MNQNKKSFASNFVPLWTENFNSGPYPLSLTSLPLYTPILGGYKL